jgi:hypothetical protein
MRRASLTRGCGMAIAMALGVAGCTTLLGDFSTGADGGSGSHPDGSVNDVGPGSEGAHDTGAGDANSSDGNVPTDAVTDTSGCAAPLKVCSNACVDVKSDVHNCGRCGHDCQGGACQAGICQALALAQASPGNDIATDGAHVYWVSRAGSALYQVDVNGQNFMTLGPSASSPFNVITGGGYVYWTTVNLGSGAVAINQTKPGNPNSTMILASFTGVQSQAGIAYDVTDTAVWLNYNNFMGYGVEECSIPSALCSVATSFAGTATDNMATDGTSFVYFGDKVGGVIEQATLPGANVSPVTSSASAPNLLAYSSGTLYWADSGSSTLWRYNAALGPPMNIGSTGSPVDGLAADATNIYWGQSASGTLSYAPNTGGSAVTYVQGTAGTTPMRMARDGVALYYLQGNGAYKVALP